MDTKKVVKGKYIETDSKGKDVIRYASLKYTKEELAQQREDFEQEAKSGKLLCLSDLIGNHGI